MNLNGYLEKFFDRIVRSFLNKIFEKRSSTSEPIEPKRIVLFTLPFSGLHSVQIRNKLINYFPWLIHIFKFVAFFDLCRLSTFFRFKYRIPLSLRSRIVYKYKCQCCKALYVGKTFMIIISLLVTLSLLMISPFCPPALHLLNFC